MTGLDDRLRAARSALHDEVRPVTPDASAIGRRHRRRRARLGTTAAVGAALVLAAVVTTGDDGTDTTIAADRPETSTPLTDDQPVEPTSGGSPSTATTTTADDVETANSLGPGSWEGARTTPDGAGLVISFVGGAQYRAGEPCTVDYRAVATETEEQVRVTILARTPRPDGDPGGCTLMGYPRTVEVALSRPLAGRVLVEEQFGREHPVFDGSTLLTPESLPAGWNELVEGPGFLDPEASRYWSRTWGPSTPAPIGDACAPGAQPVTLVQGPADLVERYPSNGEQPEATFVVRGSEATYLAGGASEVSRLTWTEGDTGFVLVAMPRCVGGPPPAPEFLVEFGNSLREP